MAPAWAEMCPWPLLFWSHLLVPMSMSRERKSLSKSPLFTARIGRAAPKKISTFEAPNCRFQLILTLPSSQNMSAKSLILRRARTCVNTMMGAEASSPRNPHARCRCRRPLAATSTSPAASSSSATCCRMKAQRSCGRMLRRAQHQPSAAQPRFRKFGL